MINDSPHLYRRVGLQAGRDRGLLDRVIVQSALLEEKGFASVLTLKHLAWQTGASYTYLREIVQRRRDPYTEIHRRRRNGAEMRVISSPDPPLMAVQRWILRRVVQHMAVHPASYAYMPGNSIGRCAEKHVGATWLIKMDVHDFFHYIDERQVYLAFSRVGYNRLIALEMARICTRQGLGPHVIGFDIPHYTISSYRSLSMGTLPQGAPTSGALANVIMRPCDIKLSGLALEYGLMYTRYADDITFSSGAGFTRAEAQKVIKLAGVVLSQCGFTPHARKTRISTPGSRKIVLGLLVDGDSIHLSRSHRQRISDHIRGVRIFGLKEHAKHYGFTSTFGFVNHVNGLLGFAHDIDPEFAEVSFQRWSEALQGHGWRAPII